MKIIGKTVDGYIVEATGEELAKAAGYYGLREIPGVKQISTGYGGYLYELPVGTKILPSRTHNYLNALRDNEDKVRQSEGMLRALADMLRAALPTTIILPRDPDVPEPVVEAPVP